MKRNVRTFLRRFGRLFALTSMLGIVSVGIFLGSSRIFEIQTIEIKAEGISLVLDERRITKNLLFFPSQKIRRELLKENPLLSDIRFIKRYPHSLIIEPVLRVAVAQLSTDQRVVLLDKEGVVLSDSEARVQTMLIFDVGSVRMGQKVQDSRVQQSLRFLSAIANRENVSQVTNKDDASLVAKIDESDILFTHNGDVQAAAATLQTLLEGIRIKGTLPKVIDLRFDKPIVIF